MAQKLRLLEAAKFEGTEFDWLVHFVHDVFHTPIHSAIGNSFVSFVAATMMVVITFSTQDTLAYMSLLAK